MTADTAWTRDPDTLEKIFHAALSQGDTRGVEAALTLMAVCDPHRTRKIINELRDALAVARFLHGAATP
jgi:hypothetical protein